MQPLIPLHVEPKLIPKLWGGRVLEQELGVPLPPGQAIGEAWLLYDRPDGSSRLRGRTETLRELVQRDARALLGADVAAGYGGAFPLLLKFIDAREALSLQVHPDDAQASAEHDSGKNEACIVLHAGPQARMVFGLRAGVSREKFLATAHTPEVEGLLHTFAPKAGDCVEVPTGTVHAIGPDVVVFEVEQNSDVTYRLNDWGRGRELQVEKAREAVRHIAPPDAVEPRPLVAPRALADGGSQLVQNQWFRVRRYGLKAGITLPTNGRFLTVTVVGGRGTLGWRSGGDDPPLRLAAGDTVLVPACASEVFLSPIGGLDVLVCDPGRMPGDPS